MFAQKNLVTLLLALIAGLAAPWVELVSPAAGVLIMALCASLIIYFQVLHDRRQIFRLKTNFFLAAALVSATAFLVGGLGAYFWMKHPRFPTAIEQLTRLYADCRSLEREGMRIRSAAEESAEFIAYSDRVRRLSGAVGYVVQNQMSESALERVNAPPNAIRSVLGISEPSRRLANSLHTLCTNMEALIENDAWH
jgi:hypothetical protein